MIKAAIEKMGKETGIAYGKAEVKRVLSKFKAEKVEQLLESEYLDVIQAFERVASTFTSDAIEVAN